jgi:sec-independent protein translocase protein TatA
MPFNIGPMELILILAIALLVLGPGKLPDVGKSLGESIREFRKATTDIKEAASLEPRPAAAPAPAAPVAPVASAAAPALVEPPSAPVSDPGTGSTPAPQA